MDNHFESLGSHGDRVADVAEAEQAYRFSHQLGVSGLGWRSTIEPISTAEPLVRSND